MTVMVSSGGTGGRQRERRCGRVIGVLLLLLIRVSFPHLSRLGRTHDRRRPAPVDDGIPITDPQFYSSETLCPDSVIEYVFRPVKQSSETIPLLKQRIAIMREVGFILCTVSLAIRGEMVKI